MIHLLARCVMIVWRWRAIPEEGCWSTPEAWGGHYRPHLATVGRPAERKAGGCHAEAGQGPEFQVSGVFVVTME